MQKATEARKKDEKRAPTVVLPGRPQIQRTLSQQQTPQVKMLQQQLQQQRNKMNQLQHMVMRLHAEEKQLLEDRIRYSLRLEKGKKKLQEMQKNIGKPEYFLQYNQAANHYVQQMILQQSSKEAPHEPDPDRMSYEQLLELGQKIGKVSKGLTIQELEMLKKVQFSRSKLSKSQQCTICCQHYKPTDILVMLKCDHHYHEECILGWFKEENACPLCKTSAV